MTKVDIEREEVDQIMVKEQTDIGVDESDEEGDTVIGTGVGRDAYIIPPSNSEIEVTEEVEREEDDDEEEEEEQKFLKKCCCQMVTQMKMIGILTIPQKMREMVEKRMVE